MSSLNLRSWENLRTLENILQKEIDYTYRWKETQETLDTDRPLTNEQTTYAGKDQGMRLKALEKVQKHYLWLQIYFLCIIFVWELKSALLIQFCNSTM